MNAYHVWGVGILATCFAILLTITGIQIISTYGWSSTVTVLGFSGIFILGIWLCLKGDKKQEQENEGIQ